MIIVDCEQLSDEWFAARCGVPSASRFNKIVTTNGDRSKQATAYMYQLAGERIIGKAEETYMSASMQRGIEMEPKARQLYEMINDVDVQEVGLCYNDEHKQCSCSPDGLIDPKGLEIKCPEIHTHIDYLLRGKLPTAYFQQVQGSMLVTGYDEWDFMSYFPGLPPLIVTVERNENFITALSEQLDEFCFDLAITTRKLKEMANG
jgi:putative phage-type endonuclease